MKALIDIASSAFARVLSRPRWAGLNDALLKATLRARGYQDWSGRGEAWLIEKVLPSLDIQVVIDVGANVGDYAHGVLEHTDAKVYCFEPQPHVVTMLHSRLQPFGSRAVVIPLGVGAQSGSLDLFYNPNSPELASFSKEVNAISYVDNQASIKVQVVSLDEFAAQSRLTRVDFIKIDTEGYELEVLKGAERVLRELKPALVQLEFNMHHLLRGTSLYALSQLIPDYDLYQLVPGGWARRDPLDPFTNVYRHANFVFVRRGVLNR